MEYGERRSQPYSGEYDWLGPDLMQNKRGCHILILTAVLITLTHMVYPWSCTGPELVLHYPPIEWSLL